MDKKQILMFVFALVAGVLGVFLASSYVTSTIEKRAQEDREYFEAQQKQTAAALQQQTDQKIAMLVEDIKRANAEQNQTLQKQMGEMQKNMAQQKAAAAVPEKRIKPSLALKTPAGKRAVTVKLESLAAVGGLLNPGEMVDVIAHLSVPQGADGEAAKTKNTVTAMIFQGLQVLAVNTNVDETGKYYDEQQSAPAVKVTVAVSPEEAGLLAFADKNGKLELALRNNDETDTQMVKASTWKNLADYVLENQGADIELPEELKGVKQEEEKVEKPTIQIYRGGKEL